MEEAVSREVDGYRYRLYDRSKAASNLRRYIRYNMEENGKKGAPQARILLSLVREY
jgi:hypothetical protein